ncbi:3'5'-cyclic nucleotide phosphodiesterase family protein [Coccidioides posadasii C735 delta SOWgp]|uniref:Phosphodiesterase n=1 Tax=Coccidioides posadasii (strain C735) TaxID=222929 RepID=C5P0W0_COCP7|nr:3'5'-cyclic nucleotide phosphodiesterase family protein [Coccidioides posadasii C735 delta SOWgp]EER29318.1 3'5'-cyclic nucleotide phosphodiesterase family protein [Coccidioides posadasii C735 delta SOWgp]|eukprot:XP_003071463.1 3'5'-cyclic nucleotide phosphodiesterase family protein [Coccidioides posadasii C735 delta SOWgp]
MDREQCRAVYIDERVSYDRWISKESLSLPEDDSGGAPFPLLDDHPNLASNIGQILGICKQVYLCNSGKSFASKLAELHEESSNTCAPIFAFIDIAIKGDSELVHRRSITQTSVQLSASPPSLARSLTFSTESEELYGFHLLSRFSADIHAQDEPSIIVPIAILRHADGDADGECADKGIHEDGKQGLRTIPAEVEFKQVRRCLDAGAIDVLTCPFEDSKVKGLVLHAYRTQKAAQKHRARFLARRKVRRQSWVGADDQQSYAYLREAMVSKLMKRICSPEEAVGDFQVGDVPVIQERKALVEREVAKWNFLSHEFSDDELVHAACVMVEHALQLPELEQWRLSPEEIRSFLLSVRASYNSFVLYHNFRHAIDVLQSVFHFLVKIGILPPFPLGSEEVSTRSGMSSILTPFDALTLLITAIGHDVGHPGVNNVFLVKLNAPLAQLYNDKSVLEAFHCAAYSQILRRHWPSVFKDTRLRKLMIDSILATDMGIHNVFMESLGKLQQSYRSNNRTTWGWEPKDIDTYRTLLCALLIKCADISNVARPFHIAEKWTDILQLEFANQGMMEAEIGMETALFGGPPELGNFVKKANGQIGFMNVFALPLFDGVADVLPDMAFAANEIRRNKCRWQMSVDRQNDPDAGEKSGIQISPAQSTETRNVRTHLKAEDYSLPSVYYTIPSRASPDSSGDTSPGPSQGDSRSDNEADDGTVTNAEHNSQESSTPKYHLPPISSPNNTNGANSHGGYSYNHTDANSASQRFHNDSDKHQFRQGFGGSPVSAVFNHSSQSTNGVRNQSTSTYTNNTVATPVSSTSQASSLVTAESNGYDDKGFGKRAYGQGIRSGGPNSYESSLGDGACDDNLGCRRPSTAALPVDSSCNRRQSERGRRPALGRTASFMSTLLDKSFSTNHHNGFTLKNPASPTCSGHSNTPSHHLSNSQHSSDPDYPTTNGASVPTGRTVPRRRSRLRLAFWRRNKPSSPPLPHEQHR